MVDVIEDTIEVDFTIADSPWLVIEAIVELSQTATPNYVDMIITPDPGETLGELPENTTDLIGSTAELNVDTSLLSERDSEAEEDTLLFKGNLANISPTGENVFEAILYDPSQQAFAVEDQDETVSTAEEDEEGETVAGAELSVAGGSIINQEMFLPKPKYGYEDIYPDGTAGTEQFTYAVPASEILDKIIEKLPLEEDETEILLQEGGVTINNERGSFTGGYDRDLWFDSDTIKIKTALDSIASRTESVYYFKKDGTFYFGPPQPTKHDLRFITETTAGIDTPPYQSVQVIGSGVASADGQQKIPLNPENAIVSSARLATYVEEQEEEIIIVQGGLAQPIFEYRNNEISSQAQADSAARSIAQELKKQQASGTITVVGFPEIEIYDGVKMPNTKKQPMGGYAYGVYKVRHILNGSDGFITEIEVAGITEDVATVTDFSVDRVVTADDEEFYVPARQRQGGPGTGLDNIQ